MTQRDRKEELDELLESLDADELRRLVAEAAGRKRARAAHGPVGRVGWLAVSVAVLMASVAVAQGGDGGGAPGARDAARGDPVQVQVRNRSSGETGLVTSSDDYSLRLSNTKENGGGGAVYGCRAPSSAPADDRACLYADNLRGGEAFLFRSREGSKVGHFDLGNPAGAPFSTNATGLVNNLNADRLDDLHAADIIGQSRAKAGLAAESADTATTATTAANATQLGGLAPAAYQPVTAADSDSLVTGLGLAPSELLSAAVTTTVPTRILASASLEIDSNGGSDDRVECRIVRENTGNSISQLYQTDIPEGTFDRTNIAINGSTTQAAGTHTIKVFCNMAAGVVTYIAGNLIVWAVPQP